MRLVFMRESDLDLMGGVMTSALFSDERPLTGDEFLAIGETFERVELFDGSLHVTPAPTPQHQYVSGSLLVALRAAAREAGLHVLEAINLRLRPDRIPIPDLVITGDINFRDPVVDAGAVRLVCEILSPSNPVTDKVLKMHYYAAAGIRRYLLVDAESGTLHLHELDGDKYLQRSITRSGETLRLTEPVVVELEPASLLPPR